MYEVGDFVMKISNGVCRIDDITHLDISGVDKDKLYYVLTPVEGGKSTMYVSVNTADKNIRSALTKSEAQEVIASIPTIAEAWIINDKLREQQYKEAVRSGNPQALISIIKTIYLRRKMREDQGKKNTAVDERYYKQAEELLYAEIAFALDCKRSDIEEIVTKALE